MNTTVRTAGTNISGLSLKEGLEKAGMDWKVVPRPILVEGTSRNIRANGYVALMRSDLRDGDPQPLDITSDKYEVFQNSQITGMMQEAAAAAESGLERIGSYAGGRRIWGVTAATERSKAEIGVGDIVSVKMRMTSGHQSGIALRIQMMVERLVCLNGATAREISGSIAIPHRRKLTDGDLEKVKRLYTESVEGFQNWIQRARDLRNAKAQTGVTRLIVAELLGQDLLREAVKNTVSTHIWENHLRGVQTDRGQFLSRAAENTAGNHLEWGEGVSTRHKNLIDEIVNETERFQVGRELARGTLWNTYSGITHHFNHTSGRNADTGLESAFNGRGKKIMEEAFELCHEVAMA